MRSLVLCYAPEDEGFARRLGGYLAANLRIGVAYGEGVVQAGFDLVDAAEQALSADVALVLLSSHSAPAAWSRPKWEPVFFQKPEEFGALLGFVQVDECRFPELLRSRARFFDARGGEWLREARRIRRWLLRPDLPVSREDFLEGPLTGVLDAPGVASSIPYAEAVAFGRAVEKDFEAVHTFDCLGRSAAGIAGDIGWALGLRLPGNTDENWDALRARCAAHRELFVFANVGEAERLRVEFGGLSSVVFTCDGPARTRASAEQIGAVFFTPPRDEGQCAALLGDAVFRMGEGLAGDFEAGLRLGWTIVAVLKGAQRFAEAIEVLQAMEQAARSRDDGMALYRIEWEQSWLRDSAEGAETGTILPVDSGEAAQLSLFG